MKRLFAIALMSLFAVASQAQTTQTIPALDNAVAADLHDNVHIWMADSTGSTWDRDVLLSVLLQALIESDGDFSIRMLDSASIDTQAEFESLLFTLPTGGGAGSISVTEDNNNTNTVDTAKELDFGLGFNVTADSDTATVVLGLSSANLATAVTDETGTGGLAVFNSNPTLAGATLSADLAAGGNNISNLGDITFQTGATGGTIRTGVSNADKFVLQAYDVDGAAYQTVLEADAANVPTLKTHIDLEPNADGTLDLGRNALRWDSLYVDDIKVTNGIQDSEVANNITLTDITQIQARSVLSLTSSCADGQVLGGDGVGGVECEMDPDSRLTSMEADTLVFPLWDLKNAAWKMVSADSLQILMTDPLGTDLFPKRLVDTADVQSQNDFATLFAWDPATLDLDVSSGGSVLMSGTDKCIRAGASGLIEADTGDCVVDDANGDVTIARRLTADHYITTQQSLTSDGTDTMDVDLGGIMELQLVDGVNSALIVNNTQNGAAYYLRTIQDATDGGQTLTLNGTSVDLNSATSDTTGISFIQLGGSIRIFSEAEPIVEADLSVTNSPTDNYCLTYDSASGGFTWDVCSSGGTISVTKDNNATNTVDAAAELDFQSGLLVVADSDTAAVDVDSTYAFQWTGNHTWDDGVGDSPKLRLQDATNNWWDIYINDGGGQLTFCNASPCTAGTLTADFYGGFWAQNDLYTDDNLFVGDTVFVGYATQDGVLALLDQATPDDTVFVKTVGDGSGVSYTLTLPVDDGTSGQYLQTDGSGVLSWTTPGGSGDITTVGNCTTGDCGIEGGTDVFPLLQEGTANDFETTFQVTDPTADRTITFPDATGEVSLLGQTIGAAEIETAAIDSTHLENAIASIFEDGGSNELAITAGMMNTGTGAAATTVWAGDNTWTQVDSTHIDDAIAAEFEDGGTNELAITAGMMNTGTGAAATTVWAGDNTWTEIDSTHIANDAILPGDIGAADFGDWTCTAVNGTCTLDNDVVAAAEMADADHGDVSWSGGTATVQAVATNHVFTGATVSRTYTLPDATATILTDNAAVTVAQGGTGVSTLEDGALLVGAGAGNVEAVSAVATGSVLVSAGVSTNPVWDSTPDLGTPSAVNLANATGIVTGGITNGTILPADHDSIHVQYQYWLPADTSTALTAGTRLIARTQQGWRITDIEAFCLVAPTGGVMTITVKDDGTSVLSTNLTIDATEKTSTTAATPPVIDGANDDIADDSEIEVRVSSVSTGGKGCAVTMLGYAEAW